MRRGAADPCSCSPSAPGSSTRALGGVDDCILPRPDRGRPGAVGRPLAAVDNLLVTAQEVALGHRSSRSCSALALRRRDAPVAPLRRAAVPAARRLAGRPDRRRRAAAGRLVRLRHRRRSSRSSRSSASSRSSVTTLDALAAVDPEQLKLLRTLDASRRQALRWVEVPAALPAALSGAKIAVAVAVIGAVFAEYAGSERGPRPPASSRRSPSSRPPAPRRPSSLLAAFAVALFCAAGARRAPARALGPDRKEPRVTRRLAVLAVLAAAWLGLAACGEKDDRRPAPTAAAARA